MIWLYFALGIIALIGLLLVCSLKVKLHIDKTVCLKISFLGISLYSFDSAYAKGSHTKKPKKKKPKKEGSPLIDSIKKYASSKNKPELIAEIFTYLRLLCEKFRKIIPHIRFYDLNMNLAVATEDAAQTAILYGNLSSLIYPVCTLLSCATHFYTQNISVSADFSGKNIRFNLSTIIKIRLFFILKLLISLVFSLSKIKIGDLKNGRTQH